MFSSKMSRPTTAHVRRVIALATVAAMMLFGLVAVTGPAQAKVSGPNGRILFLRPDPSIGENVAYTVNPDGSAVKKLFSSAIGEPAHWSPDGSQIAIDSQFACPNAGFNCDSAIIVNPDTGTLRELKNPVPTLLDDFFCTVWSPDATRLACLGTSDTDQSANGVYTVRSSDGGGLTRITGNVPPGGADRPDDYSPDGKSLVFTRDDGDGNVSFFVVKLNGGRMQQITTPPEMVLREIDGSWSPSGNKILFSARSDPDHRFGIWVVNSDGTGLQQVAIPGCGGAFSDSTSIGCFDTSWSPDGTKIIFSRFDPRTRLQNIYTANADGSGLSQVTRSGLNDQAPDWGPHPLATP